jgi:phenylalanyl-tRNA synthetase beta chain
MKFTLPWLKEHLDTVASLPEIVDKLTMIGLEVENVEDKAALLAPFVIANVVSAETSAPPATASPFRLSAARPTRAPA